jgi:hypothetical protein
MFKGLKLIFKLGSAAIEKQHLLTQGVHYWYSISCLSPVSLVCVIRLGMFLAGALISCLVIISPLSKILISGIEFLLKL